MKRVVINFERLHPICFIAQLIFLYLGVRIAIIFIGLYIYDFVKGFLVDNHIFEKGKIPFEVCEESEEEQ